MNSGSFVFSYLGFHRCKTKNSTSIQFAPFTLIQICTHICMYVSRHMLCMYHPLPLERQTNANLSLPLCQGAIDSPELLSQCAILFNFELV